MSPLQFVVTPEFPEEFPSDFNASAGGNVTFSCIATGLPEPNITWYKDGQEIVDGVNTTVLLRRTASTLTLQNVDHSDAGVYWCNGSNFLFEFLESMSPTGLLSVHCE